MVDAELGAKRSCPSCSSRFYDLNNDPIVCPSCGESFIVEPILPSKSDAPPPAKPAEPAPEPAKKETAAVASLDDADSDDDDDDDADDEAAVIEGVDLGDDVEIEADGDDDTFLEEEDDDDAPAIGIIGATKPDDTES